MRASSANQISIVLQSMPFSRATVSRRVGKLMEWPAPPSRRDILAGDSNRGADDENCSAWHRPRQECVQCCWSGPIRCCGPTSAGPEGYADRPGRKTAELHCRHEACCGAHHLGRLFAAQGHDIRLMSSEYARPYVKAQKNDDRDAEGIAEAATRLTMRFVEMKTEGQRYADTPPIERTAARMAGLGSASVDDRRQATTPWGQQARKQVPAQAADPW